MRKWWYHFLTWEHSGKGKLGAAVDFIWANAAIEVSMDHPVEIWSTSALSVFLCSPQFLSIINNIAMNNILINVFMQSLTISSCLWHSERIFFLNIALIYYIYPYLSPDLNLKSLPKLSSHSFPHCLSYKHFHILGTMPGTKHAK